MVMTHSDDNYFGIILEEIRDQNKAVLEAVGDIQRNVADLPIIRADIAALKSDMKVVKAVVKDISKHVNNHELRITKLEAA
jgi:hypothetical protein